MALNRPALVDALTDAGLEAEAVRRAVDVLEQGYADTAKQSEMHLRFDALEKSLADHDRLNEEQLAGINKQFEGINKQFEGIDRQFDAADKQSKSLSSRLQDFKDEVDRRFSDLKESMDREFAAVRSEMASLRNEMTTEFAAVRSEMASLRSELNGKITMLQWMIGVLFVMNGTTLGIVIAKLL